MGGVDAMWNVAELLNKVLSEQVAGDCVETGVWKGANGVLVSRLLEAANDTARKVWCLDSFRWVPPRGVVTHLRQTIPMASSGAAAPPI